MMNNPKYYSDERELILRVMDLYFHSPEYARKLDFSELNELFPDLVSVFDFMQSEEYLKTYWDVIKEAIHG